MEYCRRIRARSRRRFYGSRRFPESLSRFIKFRSAKDGGIEGYIIYRLIVGKASFSLKIVANSLNYHQDKTKAKERGNESRASHEPHSGNGFGAVQGVIAETEYSEVNSEEIFREGRPILET